MEDTELLKEKYKEYLDDNSSWEGIDVDKEISLFEYNMLVDMNDDDNDDETYNVLFYNVMARDYMIRMYNVIDLIDALTPYKLKNFCEFGDIDVDSIKEYAKSDPIHFLSTYYNYFGLF